MILLHCMKLRLLAAILTEKVVTLIIRNVLEQPARRLNNFSPGPNMNLSLSFFESKCWSGLLQITKVTVFPIVEVASIDLIGIRLLSSSWKLLSPILLPTPQNVLLPAVQSYHAGDVNTKTPG